jgi:hypothetical protein
MREKSNWFSNLIRLYAEAAYPFFKQHCGASAPLFYASSRLSECELHTLIHTFAILYQLQDLCLNIENAEFLASLFFSSTSWAEVFVGKV